MGKRAAGRSLSRSRSPATSEVEFWGDLRALEAHPLCPTVRVGLALLDGLTLEMDLDSDGTVAQLVACLEELVDAQAFEAYRRRGVVVLLGSDSCRARWGLREDLFARLMSTKLVRDLVAAGRPVNFQLVLTTLPQPVPLDPRPSLDVEAAA